MTIVLLLTAGSLVGFLAGVTFVFTVDRDG